MNREQVSKLIKVFKSNKHYRIGDIICKFGNRWAKDSRHIVRNPGKYKDSILYNYIKNPDKVWAKQKYKKLGHYIKNSKKNKNIQELPNEQELVIHLRAGDVFDCRRRLQNYCKQVSTIFKSRSFFKKCKKINIDEVKKATIVTAFHFGANEQNGRFFYADHKYSRSMDAVMFLINQLERLDLEWSIISNEDIDLDVLYMFNAQKFIGIDPRKTRPQAESTMSRIIKHSRRYILSQKAKKQREKAVQEAKDEK